MWGSDIFIRFSVLGPYSAVRFDFGRNDSIASIRFVSTKITNVSALLRHSKLGHGAVCTRAIAITVGRKRRSAIIRDMMKYAMWRWSVGGKVGNQPERTEFFSIRAAERNRNFDKQIQTLTFRLHECDMKDFLPPLHRKTQWCFLSQKMHDTNFFWINGRFSVV